MANNTDGSAVRLLNFVSEHEVEEIKKQRADRGETESTVPDRPLFEILKENKDRQQSEFNERFKHQPPKALDEDETEFLENLDRYRKEQELLVANEEAQQLLTFQLAVANRTTTVKEPLSSFRQTKVEPLPQKEKKPDPVKSILSTIKIKPQPKKARLDNTSSSSEGVPQVVSALTDGKDLEAAKSEQKSDAQPVNLGRKSDVFTVTSLVAYGTDSEEEDDE